MKVCADFIEQTDALNAHKKLVDGGVDPEDIEIRSPYPLMEAPIPPHHSRPMIMRNVVRVMWLCGIILGFSFLTYTQLEWGEVAKTNGHPLVSIPINAIIMYECGMVTAILVTTIMFFVETRRYRDLVPPLEEDMPVAEGYVAVVVKEGSSERAKGLLEGSPGMRNLATYLVPLMCSVLLLSGCHKNYTYDNFHVPLPTTNMRQQQVLKETEAPAEPSPAESVRMPSAKEAELLPPEPFAFLRAGDVATYEKLEAESKAEVDKVKGREKAKVRSKYNKLKAEVAPDLMNLKAGGVPPELKDYTIPVAATKESIAKGKVLFDVNCQSCHGEAGVGVKQGVNNVGSLMYVDPPAIGTSQYDKYSDGYLYYYIMTGKNLMPHFAYKLNTQEAFDIIHYLRAQQKK